MNTPNLINEDNVSEIINGAEQEIRSMMQETMLAPIDYRMLEIIATLLELVIYLRDR